MSVEKNQEIPKVGIEGALGKLGNKVQEHSIVIENTLIISESISSMDEGDTQKCCGVLENTFLQNPEVAKLFSIQNVV